MNQLVDEEDLKKFHFWRKGHRLVLKNKTYYHIEFSKIVKIPSKRIESSFEKNSSALEHLKKYG